jgi:uncharacterized membrane protein
MRSLDGPERCNGSDVAARASVTVTEVTASSSDRGCAALYIDDVSSSAQSIARYVLGAFLMFAGVSHVSFARTAFYAQVPPWLPLNADFVVISSGIVEILLGAGLVLLVGRRVLLGWVVAIFFVVVFPGNISQFVTHANAFGLDSDLARGVRLLFQPLLVMWALWCTGAWTALRRHR